MTKTNSQIREEMENKLRNKWETFSVVNDYYENADIRLNSDRIADFFILEISELLKSQREEDKNELLPVMQASIESTFDQKMIMYRAGLVEKIEKMKLEYIPDANNITSLVKGSHNQALDDIINLIKEQ